MICFYVRQLTVKWLIVLGVFLCLAETRATELKWNYIPSNISVSAEAGKNYAIVNYLLPSVTDTAGIIVRQVNGFSSGAIVPLGKFIYEFSAEDSSGNVINCSFKVEVKDLEKPVITDCPENITTSPDSGKCSKKVNFVLPAFSDNSLLKDSRIFPGDILFTGVQCDSPDSICFVTLKKLSEGTELTITDKGWLKNGGFRKGESSLIWKATSEISAGTEIIIEGLNASTGECSGSPLSLSASGDQLFIFTGDFPVDGNSDNLICGIQLNSSSGGSDNKWDGDCTSTTTTGKPSAIIPGFNGLRFSPEKDNVVYSGARKGHPDELRKLISDPVNWLASNREDLKVQRGNITIEIPNIELVEGLTSESYFPAGTTKNTFEVKDYSGNSAQCSFNIEVKDTTKPKFYSVKDIFAYTDKNNCSAVVNYDLPVAVDICGNLTYKLIGSKLSGERFPTGETLVKIMVSDESGNSDTTSFKVTIEDKVSPTINLPANIVTIHPSGKGSVIVNYSAPIAVDNCSGTSITQISGLGSGNLFPPGITTETFMATDNSGNSTTANFFVTVKENNAPEFEAINKIEFNEDEEFWVVINFSDTDSLDKHNFNCKITDSNFIISDKQIKNKQLRFKIKSKANYYGSGKLYIELKDNSGAPNNKDTLKILLNVLPVNDPPEAEVNNIFVLKEGEKKILNSEIFIVKDIDTKIDKIQLEIVKECEYGKLFKDNIELNKKSKIEYSDFLNKKLSYKHSGDESICDTIFFKANDEQSESSLIKIPVKIISVNDVPVVKDNIDISVNEDSLLMLNKNYFSSIIKDVDTDISEMAIRLFCDSILVINKTGNTDFLVKPETNWFGNIRCTLEVNDVPHKIEKKFNFEVKSVNDPPEFLFFPKQLIFDNSSFAQINLFDFVTDVETKDTDLKFEINKPDSLFWSFDKDIGNFVITAEKGFYGTRKLGIKVKDIGGLCTNREIKIIVNNITNVNELKVPDCYKLYPPYPNPFNPTIKIIYDIPETSYLSLKIFDILGREVKILKKGECETGTYSITFNGSNLSSGVYFVVMKSKNFFKVSKIVLLK